MFNCSYNNVQQHSCYYTEDAYVQCLGIIMVTVICIHVFPIAPNTTDNCTDGEIRLTGGQSMYEGLVEICYGGAWGSICPSGWSVSDTKVVCRQLGHTPIGQ